MKQSYQNLCTEFYDLTKPVAGPKEVAFYETILRKANGPLLEAMCGSGRLLIPLLKTGLIIDGLDNSSHMLESCFRRCKENRLLVELHNQSLQNLSLAKKYSHIFIAIGSFQLIRDRTEAFQILKSLHRQLLPGGRLIIETFVPWDGIKDNIDGTVLLDQSKPISSEQKIHSQDGFNIINKSKVTINFKEQLKLIQARYEKWADGKFVFAEEEEYAVRWYYRYEMELLLEKAGFLDVQIFDESFEQNEQAVVYAASRAE